MSTQEYGRPDDSVDVSDEIAGAVVASDAALHEANRAAHRLARAYLDWSDAYERKVRDYTPENERAYRPVAAKLSAAVETYEDALRRVSPGRTEEGE